MSEIEQIRAEVEGFLEEHDLKPTTFGQKALNDPNFVFRLRKGKGLTLRTMERLRAFMNHERERENRTA